MRQENYMLEFGRRLKVARKKAGISREELGGKLFVAYSTVESWELGKRQPDLYTVCELTQILHVSAEYLITGGNQ